MSRGISTGFLGPRKAFTLVETLVAGFIATFVLLSVWSVYLIGWTWWHEMRPVVEVQRIARTALSSIIDGTIDSTASQETINSVNYGFRNGVAWAAVTNEDIIADEDFTTPVISADGHSIDFKLEKDAAAVNGRSFYAGTDAAAGEAAVYYKDSSSVAHKIKGTEVKSSEGSITLTFTGDAEDYVDLLKVTVRVQKSIPGTKYESAPLVAECSDYVYFRNR
ncbi:MAG: hypothetical protein V1682_07710 [Candidatus Omnitrophota bacterium]